MCVKRSLQKFKTTTLKIMTCLGFPTLNIFTKVAILAASGGFFCVKPIGCTYQNLCNLLLKFATGQPGTEIFNKNLKENFNSQFFGSFIFTTVLTHSDYPLTVHLIFTMEYCLCPLKNGLLC